MNSYFIGTVSLITIFALFFLIEKVTSQRTNKELTRKIAHIIAGLFAIIMASILERNAFIVLTIISVMVMIFSYRIQLFTFIHGVNRTTIGEILLPTGILSAYIIANPINVFYSSVLILTFSDTLGGLTVHFLKKKLRHLGSVVFFLSSLLILFAFYDLSMKFVLIALLLTGVERISNYGTDNLTVPFIAALILTLTL